MKWFGRKPRRPENRHPDERASQAVSELLDGYHRRASITDGDRIIMVPGQVLDNIAQAMERVDIDIDTPVSIEENVVFC